MLSIGGSFLFLLFDLRGKKAAHCRLQSGGGGGGVWKEGPVCFKSPTCVYVGRRGGGGKGEPGSGREKGGALLRLIFPCFGTKE